MTTGLLAPWQTSILRTLGEDGISGEVVTPVNGTLSVFISVPFPCVITGLSAKTASGTLTAAVQVNGVSVAGLTAVAVTSVQSNTSATPGSTTAQLATGQALTIVVSAVAAAANFAYVVKYKRPAQL